jgi:hypothetical protein
MPQMKEEKMLTLKNVELRPANAEDMDSVYKIRYKAYLRADLIAPHPSKQFKDIYDASGSAATFVLSHRQTFIGTARYVADSRIGLPMDDEGFGPCLATLRQNGRRIVEAGRLAIEPGYQNRSRELSLHLCLYGISYAMLAGYDDVVAMVFKHHQKFYEKVLMFETIASDFITSYGPNMYGLRLNLKRLIQRYERNRTARRFGLPDHLKAYQAIQLSETLNVGRPVCN